MFLSSSLYLIFIFLIYNIINFDEEFLIMITIMISFSILLDILFKNLNNSYLDFLVLLKTLYIKLVIILRIISIKLLKSYKKQRKMKRRLLYASYLLKKKLMLLLIFLNLNFKNTIKLFSLTFLSLYLFNTLLKEDYIEKEICKELINFWENSRE